MPPSTPSVTNQTSMTGPKTRPMLFVPLCWNQKSAARMTQAIPGT